MRARRAATVEAELDALGTAAPAGATGTLSIPVWFHVVYTRKGRNQVGNVSDAAIASQLAVMNDAWNGSGFSFHLAGVDRTNNGQWFTGCYGLTTELAMKQALAVDPARVLNIYTCNPQQSILGYAYLAGDLPEDDVRQGVVALYGTLPGGFAAPYDEGDTIVHEVGHYLGLLHTFSGGCSEPGDGIVDTPAEAEPAFGCPAGRDTCPAPGLDPIYNFMDYSDDVCMVEFTTDQVGRMGSSTVLYRPSLQCGSGTCDAGEACICPIDCGTPPGVESLCANGIDDDCDGRIDAADSDCGAPPPTCGAAGASCASGSECCSGSCKGKPGSQTCK